MLSGNPAMYSLNAFSILAFIFKTNEKFGIQCFLYFLSPYARNYNLLLKIANHISEYFRQPLSTDLTTQGRQRAHVLPHAQR